MQSETPLNRDDGRCSLNPAKFDHSAVASDARTAATFATFRSSWFFLETAGEYEGVLESAGFSVSLARIDEVIAREMLDDAVRV